MGLDALDVAGEVKVEVELVNVLVFVLRGPWFFVALDRLLLLFFLKCRLGHGGLDGHKAVLTPDTEREKHREKVRGGRHCIIVIVLSKRYTGTNINETQITVEIKQTSQKNLNIVCMRICSHNVFT